jgi:NAD(P)-dependent dehydrogenase (short-subunit alcohol dehydrogenase family)
MATSTDVVLITGAGSGIGAALAERFAKDGATLVLAGRRQDKLEEVAGRCGRERCLVVPTDVSSHDSLQALMDAIRGKLGRLDVLVNNAGVGYGGSLEDVEPGELDYVLRVNLVAPIWLSRLALPLLEASPEGRLVNISSMAGVVSMPHQGVYAATKAGLRAFGVCVARERGGRRPLVCTVYPGVVESEMMPPEMQAKAREVGIRGMTAMPADRAAEIIVRGVRRGERHIFVTSAPERMLAELERRAPWLLDRVVGPMAEPLRALMREGNVAFRARHSAKSRAPVEG